MCNCDCRYVSYRKQFTKYWVFVEEFSFRQDIKSASRALAQGRASGGELRERKKKGNAKIEKKEEKSEAGSRRLEKKKTPSWKFLRSNQMYQRGYIQYIGICRAIFQLSLCLPRDPRTTEIVFLCLCFFHSYVRLSELFVSIGIELEH